MPDSSRPAALFEPDADGGFVPTAAAAGPWSESALHGGAVAALLAGLLEDPEQVMTRVLVEMVAPVPRQRLHAEISPAEGGRRVVRQSVVLTHEGKAVARALALRMRATDLELPSQALEHPVRFDPADAPDLTSPNRRAAETVGRESFDSLAMATVVERSPGTSRLWLRLLVPVLPHRRASPVEQAVAAADFSSSGVVGRLPFRSWSFMSADLTVGFSRPPQGDWIGLEGTGLVSRTGTGQSSARLHDSAGPLGQASQSLLIEPRSSG